MRKMFPYVLLVLTMLMSSSTPAQAKSQSLLGVSTDTAAREPARPAKVERAARISFTVKAGRLVAGKLVSGLKQVAFNNDLDIQIDEVDSSLFEKLYQVRATGSARGVLALKAYVQTTVAMLKR